MTIGAVRLPFALAVDALWSFALAAVAVDIISGGGGRGPSFAAVAIVVLGSFALARGLQETDLDLTALRNIGAGASAIAIFAILHTEYAASSPPWDLGWLRALIVDQSAAPDVFAGCVALITLWARGITNGQQSQDFDRVIGSAAFGLAPVAIAAMALPGVRGPSAFGAMGLLYLVLSLIALALYRAPDPDRPVRAFLARWSTSGAAMIAAAAGLTLITAAIDPGAFGFIATAARPLQIAGTALAQYVLGPILGAIVLLIQWLLPSFNNELAQPTPTPAIAPAPRIAPHATPLWQQVVGYGVAGFIAAVVVILALIALWLLFKRLMTPKPRDRDRRERVDGESLLVEDLGALFDRFRRFRRSPRAPQSSVAVRRLYREMLDRAEADGLPRPAPATPLEFAPTLTARYGSGAVRAITDAFDDSRYGNHDVSESTVRELRERWKRVQQDAP